MKYLVLFLFVTQASLAISTDTYRIGPEWGKHFLDEVSWADDPALRPAVMATVSLGGATGFYLGKYGGEHLVATNQHVCSGPESYCRYMQVRFDQLDLTFNVKRVIYGFTKIDFAILTFDIGDSNHEDDIIPLGLWNRFSTDLVKDQPLFTVGYGAAGNPSRELTLNWDSDCRVLSRDYRRLADPDSFSPSAHKVWSFANGCDLSHGDSGSAIFDYQTGDVVGIVWTGKTPKSPEAQDANWIREVSDSDHEAVWNEFSYGVPAAKIYEKIAEAANDRSLPSDDQALLKALSDSIDR